MQIETYFRQRLLQRDRSETELQKTENYFYKTHFSKRVAVDRDSYDHGVQPLLQLLKKKRDFKIIEHSEL